MNKKGVSIILLIILVAIIIIVIVNTTNKGVSEIEATNIIKNCKSLRELPNVYFEQSVKATGSEDELIYVWVMGSKYKNVFAHKSLTQMGIFDYDMKTAIVYDTEKKEGIKVSNFNASYTKEITDYNIRNNEWKYVKTEYIDNYECYFFEIVKMIEDDKDVIENKIWIDKKTNCIIKQEIKYNDDDEYKEYTTQFSNISIGLLKSSDLEVPSDVKIEIK